MSSLEICVIKESGSDFDIKRQLLSNFYNFSNERNFLEKKMVIIPFNIKGEEQVYSTSSPG